MKIWIVLVVLTATATASPRVVALKAADGTPLAATYYPAAKPGPGVVLVHQVNRTRASWDDLARRLAAAGVHTLALDLREHGDSGGTPYGKLTKAELDKEWRGHPEDLDPAIAFLAAQPGVDRIGLASAGVLGVDVVVLAASHHPEVKTLVLLSGETFRDGLRYLHQATQVPALFVVADRDEYPPTVEAMLLLYATSTSPAKRLVRYAAQSDAPWLWYEPFDLGRVPATGTHGTDLFKPHPELPGIIVDWFVTALAGHARPDALAAGEIYNQLQWSPGGAAAVTNALLAARKLDPAAQLFPEVPTRIIGDDFLRVGDAKSAIAVLELVVLAYPDSPDALTSLADAYRADGQRDRARALAQKALAILDANGPAASWADSPALRELVRRDAHHTLDASP